MLIFPGVLRHIFSPLSSLRGTSTLTCVLFLHLREPVMPWMLLTVTKTNVASLKVQEKKEVGDTEGVQWQLIINILQQIWFPGGPFHEIIWNPCMDHPRRRVNWWTPSSSIKCKVPRLSPPLLHCPWMHSFYLGTGFGTCTWAGRFQFKTGYRLHCNCCVINKNVFNVFLIKPSTQQTQGDSSSIHTYSMHTVSSFCPCDCLSVSAHN